MSRIIDRTKLAMLYDGPLTITICGGGNAAHVLSAYIGADPSITVNIFNLLQSEVDLFHQVLDDGDSTISVIHREGESEIQGVVSCVSSDPLRVISEAMLVLIATPAFTHEMYLSKIAPYLRSRAFVGIMTGKCGLDWCAKSILKDKFDQITFFCLQTLPWACRIVSFGREVAVLGTKKSVEVAVTPSSKRGDVIDILAELMSVPVQDRDEQRLIAQPRFDLVPNFLCITLGDIGSLWHPIIVYGCFHDQSQFKVPPLFYQGVSDATTLDIWNANEEIMAIKHKLLQTYSCLDLSSVRGVGQWIYHAYGFMVKNRGSLKEFLHTNPVYDGIRHSMVQTKEGFVPNFYARYFIEDIPFGMAVIRSIGALVQVPTLTLDRIMNWCQQRIGKRFLNEDRSLGPDGMETRCPQRYQLDTIDKIVTLYVE